MICYNSRAADEYAEQQGKEADEDAAVEAYYTQMIEGLTEAMQDGYIDDWQYDLLVSLTETVDVDYAIRCKLEPDL